MVLVRASTATIAVPAGSCTVTIEDGWLPSRHGVRVAAPVVVLRRRATRVDLVTMVIPGTPPIEVGATVTPSRELLTARVVRDDPDAPDAGDGRDPGIVDELVWSTRDAAAGRRWPAVARWRRERTVAARRQTSWVVVS